MKHLIGFGSQDQLIGHFLMYAFIPLLLVIAAEYIHNLRNPLYPFQLLIQIIDFRVIRSSTNFWISLTLDRSTLLSRLK